MNDIKLSPFYNSAESEIKKPDSLVFCSRYFQKRWQRELGPVGTGIVLCLRAHCYHNRRTNELRDEIILAVPVIAEELGVSPKTIRRELDSNKTLQKFVRVRPSYTGKDTPSGVRRDANTYSVSMDDPLHPDDEPAITGLVRQREEERDKSHQQVDEEAKRQALLSRGQNDQAEKSPAKMTTRQAKMTISPAKMTTRQAKMTSPPGHFDQTPIESYSVLENPINSSSDDSLALFPEKRGPERAAVRRYEDLTDVEKLPWREQSERAQRVQIGLPADRPMSPRIIDARAKTLFEAGEMRE